MIKRLLKGLIGFCLLPVCLGLSSAFIVLLTELRPGRSQFFFLSGMAASAVAQLFRAQPRFAYVLGHETTHALATLLCGGRVKSLQAGDQGGYVRTTKTNTIITLAPYIVPFYALLLSLIFFLLQLIVPEIIRFRHAFLFLLGAAVSFHIFMTINSLHLEQPDILAQGRLFSFSFIYVINLVFLAGLLCAIFPEGNFMEFITNAGRHLWRMADWVNGLFAHRPS